jgi:hypothetical protein
MDYFKKIITTLILELFVFVSFGQREVNKFTPEMGVINSTELGESLLKREILTYRRGINLKEDINVSFLGSKYTIFKGTYLANNKKNKKNEIELTPVIDQSNFLGRSISIALFLNTTTNEISKVIYNNAKLKIKNEKPLIYPIEEVILKTDPLLVKDLIYNGRSAEVIKLTYREYINDLARPSFTQDVQYDLKDGNEIGFKGARIEVINATNLKIEYKVLSPFKD